MTTGTLKTDLPSRPLLSLVFSQDRLEKLLVAAMNRLHQGKLTVDFPSGNAYSLSGAQDKVDGEELHATCQLKSYKAIRRILRGQAVGFAEAYMEGDLASPDLTHLLELMACNMDAMEAALQDWSVVRTWNQVQHMLRSNTRRGSRKNIAYHYDLGNNFYELWLDQGMTYSSGIFDEQHQDLESAQEKVFNVLAGVVVLVGDGRGVE